MQKQDGLEHGLLLLSHSLYPQRNPLHNKTVIHSRKAPGGFLESTPLYQLPQNNKFTYDQNSSSNQC